MRVLVCGGRDYYKKIELFYQLSLINITHVITGGAPGADFLAEQWARQYAVPFTVCPADWARYGKRAGPIRNQRMLDEGLPDLVVAFPGGRGTADMVERAKKAGVKVLDLRE